MTDIRVTLSEAAIQVAVQSSAPAVATLASTPIAVASTPVGARGLKGDKGDAGDPGSAATTYTHTQAQPASVWTITHNLGYRPAAVVFDTADQECEGDAEHIDNNILQISFSAAFAGWARLL